MEKYPNSTALQYGNQESSRIFLDVSHFVTIAFPPATPAVLKASDFIVHLQVEGPGMRHYGHVGWTNALECEIIVKMYFFCGNRCLMLAPSADICSGGAVATDSRSLSTCGNKTTKRDAPKPCWRITSICCTPCAVAVMSLILLSAANVFFYSGPLRGN